MAIYLDSAKLEEARQARDFGWVYGVTTNPSLMARAGVRPETVLRELSALQFHQVYYQLVSHDMAEMMAEAHKAVDIVKDGLVLKIPPTANGFRFVSNYGQEFPCCITAIFSPAQALVARECGARYIAVYVNRATKQVGDGIGLVKNLSEVLRGSQTEILAASLKSSAEAVDAQVAGAHHITIPFDLLTNLPEHPLSTKTIEQFDDEGIGLSLRS